MVNGIGSINEQPLHAALKLFYAEGEGQTEVMVDGYFIDVVRDNRLFEIQTGNFSSIKRKLMTLVNSYDVTLVYPIAQEKWLYKLPVRNGEDPVRRKSPKRGCDLDVFNLLVSFPELLKNPNFSLNLVIVVEEEVREYTGEKSWRKNGWVTVERRLVKVIGEKVFETADDMAELLPGTLPDPFTTGDLAKRARISKRLAQKMAYCLRRMGVIEVSGKMGRYIQYQRI